MLLVSVAESMVDGVVHDASRGHGGFDGPRCKEAPAWTAAPALRLSRAQRSDDHALPATIVST